MKRLLYYSQLRRDSESEFRQMVNTDVESLRRDWTAQGLYDVSIFVLQQFVFIYAEADPSSEYAEWRWPRHYSRILETWPSVPLSKGHPSGSTESFEVPLIDIFHDGVPSDRSSWRDHRHIDERIGSVACLRPEMAASYIYYHFQKQEEAASSFNQTYMIGMFGTLIFSYHELPSLTSGHKPQGLLHTRQSPVHWQEAMLPHFIPWKDESGNDILWMQMERIQGSSL
ncbi:hypothetical protein MHH52_24030 [Paenibacillus sp. FSL K6-0276]|uniref:hypothetical protein n=1 Tax=Paenibacillus sp. FSL K6-0276 TaxID=2921450 RepID=UPI0030EDD02E